MKYLITVLFCMSVSLWAQTDFEKAENYFKQAKYHQAQPLFEQFLQQHPQDLKSTEYLGDIQSHLKHWETAIPYYEKLKTIRPNEAEYHYKYGGALAMLAQKSNRLRALSMLNEITQAFDKTLVLNKKHIGARWALIELYLQLPGILGGSEKKAVRYANELAVLSPIDGYLSKGHIEEYFKRYGKAEVYYKKAIETGNSPTSSQKLANLYKNKMNQPEKATQVLTAFKEKNKS